MELKELKKILIDKKITAKELAQAVKYSTPHISKILNGHNIPNLILAFRIAKFLNLTVEECFPEILSNSQ